MSAETIVGYCRACGRALAEADAHRAHGAMYCKEHAPMEGAPSSPGPSPGSSPYDAPPYNNAAYGAPLPGDVSPGRAFALGFIPGVGAIYNGQYVKGLVHVAVIGILISILNDDIPGRFEPLVALMLVAFWAYMPFEAYHTARSRKLGHPADEFSSIMPMGSSQFPGAAWLLIGLGTVLLLDNLHIFELRRMLRFWPMLLIAAGLYMLYNRATGSKGPRP
jgi:Domain of unknown function (DUF5668)